MGHCQLDVSFFSSMFTRNILLYSDQRKSSQLVRFTEKNLIILWEYMLIHVCYLKKFFISLVMLLDSANLAVFIIQSLRLSVCPSMAMLCMIVWFSDFCQKLQFHNHKSEGAGPNPDKKWIGLCPISWNFNNWFCYEPLKIVWTWGGPIFGKKCFFC